MTENQQDQAKKFRRKLPCVNHPRVAAVAYCAICGNPICKTCIGFHGGSYICSSECWTNKITRESKEIFDRGARSKKWKARLSAFAGAAGILFLFVGAFLFVHPKITNHMGEKQWELTYAPSCFAFTVKPSANTLVLLRNDGALEAIDAPTGRKIWTARLPEGHEGCKATIIDRNRSIVYYADKVLLCRADRTVPVWEYTLPQVHLSAPPVFLNEVIFLASSSAMSGTEAPLGLQETASNFGMGLKDDRRQISDISAVEISSGAELWKMRLKDVSVEAFLVDGNTVYVLGFEFAPPDTGPERKAKSGGAVSDKEGENPEIVSRLFALSSATGRLKWEMELKGRCLLAPVPHPDGIIIPTWDSIHCISSTGTVRWRHPFVGQVILSVDCSADSVFVLTGDGFLTCIDSASGRRTWMAEVGMRAGCIHPAPPNIYICGTKQKSAATVPAATRQRFESMENAVAKSDSNMDAEKTLCVLNVESGERSLAKMIGGRIQFRDSTLYSIRCLDTRQDQESAGVMDEGIRPTSILCAYDCLTGEKTWEALLNGKARELALTDSMAVVKVVPGAGQNDGGSDVESAVRLAAFSLR